MNRQNINWEILLFIVGYQVLVLAAAPFYFTITPTSLAMILVSAALFVATGISITAGYHRLYSHKSYNASRFVEIPLLFFGTIAGQGSALRWANDHRLHHAHVDTDRDPYSVSKGFWYAHILWMFEKRPDINPKLVQDLLKNPLIVYQDRYYVPLFFGLNALTAALIGWALGDFIGAFYLAWWARLFAVHHSTWFINSLAHTWGSRSYSKEFSAVDNYIISLLTFGEGYHNYHHFFATDYRNGIRWYHFDPTKWLIWTLHKLGLAQNLRRIDAYKIKKQVLKNDMDLLFERVRSQSVKNREAIEDKINTTFEKLSQRITELNELKKKYLQIKHNAADSDAIREIRTEMRILQDKFHRDWKRWQSLFDAVMDRKPLPL
jgi:stearoyl-CoA desaturase (delta-9 desaturase)